MYLSWNTFFLHFYEAKIQNGYPRWTNHKILIYFELYMREGWAFFLLHLPTVAGLCHLSPLSGNLYICVGGCCLLFDFLYVSCSSINQAVKHPSIQWKHSCIYLCLPWRQRIIAVSMQTKWVQTWLDFVLSRWLPLSCLTSMPQFVCKVTVRIT